MIFKKNESENAPTSPDSTVFNQMGAKFIR